jgi:predicted O-methyltransferase YrrM
MQSVFGTRRDELALDEGEAFILYGLVRAIKPETCLEIGTHQGVSATYIAEALHDNKKGHLHTTDPFDYQQRQTFPHDLKQYVTFYDKRGADIKLENKIDFAFIDGFHDNVTVLEEIENVLPQLAPGAIVVFHDAQDEPTNWEIGVNKAITDAGILEKCVWLPTTYGLQVYRHTEKAPVKTKKKK